MSKSVIITGGAGNIGSSLFGLFSDTIDNIIVVDIAEAFTSDRYLQSKATAECTLTEIACDLTDEIAIRDFCSSIVEQDLDLVGLVNCAAITGEFLTKKLKYDFGEFKDLDLKTWQKVMEINLTAPFLILQGLERSIVASKTSIVNISSIYGHMAPDHRIYSDQTFNSILPYSVSKAGLHSMTQWLSTYWASQGVRVNTVAPGGIFSGHNEKFVADYSNRIPLGRMGKAKDMAGIIEFLVSDRSEYITGQLMFVDGGLNTW